ncbi:l-serine dehydratase [Aspergillus sp. HF37]|nr:l-serine dehydratase [Aspergillus sp. HF37]
MGHFDRTQGKKPWIETPLIESTALSKTAGCRIFLKLELLQPSGSFKSRGIGNLVLASLSDRANSGKELRFYSSSGGNAGLAAVIATRDLGCGCTVVVPRSTKPLMVRKLHDAGAADVIQHGASWFEADTYLRETFIDNQDGSGSGSRRNIYVPPFDHPEIWNGAATLVPEIVGQLPPRRELDDASPFPADAVVCSVGGGGLFNGVVNGLGKYLQSNHSNGDGKNVQVLAVETEGAESLAISLRRGHLQSLSDITSLATSLGALRVAPQTLEYAQSPPAGVEVKSIVGSDAEAAQGVIRLADELRLQVELACGISVEVAVKKLREVMDLRPESRVVVVVCGGSNVTAEMIADFRQRLQNGWA